MVSVRRPFLPLLLTGEWREMCPLNEPTDKETRALLGLEASVRRSLGGLMPLGLKKWGTHGMSGKEALSRYQRRNLTKAPHEETGTS